MKQEKVSNRGRLGSFIIVALILNHGFAISEGYADQKEPQLSQRQLLRDSLKRKLSQSLRKSQKDPEEASLEDSGDTKKIKYKSAWQRLKDNYNAQKLRVQIGNDIYIIKNRTSCDLKEMHKLLKSKMLLEKTAMAASCTCCVTKELGRGQTFANAFRDCKTVSKKCLGKPPFENEEEFLEQTNIEALNAPEGVSEKLKITSPSRAVEGVTVIDNSYERYLWNTEAFYLEDKFGPDTYHLKFGYDRGYLNQNPQLLTTAINPYNHHFDPKDATFFNPWPNAAPPTAFINAASGILGAANIKNTQRPWAPQVVHPVKPPPSFHGIRATMIGHATVLLQVDGVNILTDPIYFDIGFGKKEDKTFKGYKRIKDPGVTFEDLPKLDFIVISHNHRDHLDVPTLLRLEKDHPNVKYITPLGYTDFLKKIGLNKTGDNRIFELDWWDSIDFPMIRFTALPTQHWCGRSVNDVNKMLWSAYAITTHRDPNSSRPVPSNWRPKSIYFAGDTGFGPHFEEIMEKFPDYFERKYQTIMRQYPGFDLSLIPIGAYCPMDKEGGGHINPYEAVKVHRILKSKHSIGIHFDTFQVAQEPYGEAKKILEETILRKSIEQTTFIALETTESVLIDVSGQYQHFPNK